jgi:hypothetical protein
MPAHYFAEMCTDTRPVGRQRFFDCPQSGRLGLGKRRRNNLQDRSGTRGDVGETISHDHLIGADNHEIKCNTVMGFNRFFLWLTDSV